jgi:hypothetical protein
MELGHVGDKRVGNCDIPVHNRFLGGGIGERPKCLHITGDIG